MLRLRLAVAPLIKKIKKTHGGCRDGAQAANGGQTIGV